jgi:hypothetical protein
MLASGIGQRHEAEAVVESPLLDERGAGGALGSYDVVVVWVVNCDFESVSRKIHSQLQQFYCRDRGETSVFGFGLLLVGMSRNLIHHVKVALGVEVHDTVGRCGRGGEGAERGGEMC